MIELHKGQSQVIQYLFPHRVFKGRSSRGVFYAPVTASRGFGKSFLASSAAVMACDDLMRMPANVPNKNVSIIAPTYSQVVDIYYPMLAYTFGLEKIALKSSQATGRFILPRGVELRLWSYEAIERMRGTGQYFVVADEVTSWEGRPGLQDAWESIIQPTMTTRWPGNHRAMIITTPKGFDYYHDMTHLQDTDNRYKSFHYTYRDSPYLDVAEIERVKLTTDPIRFAREYEASFEESGANVFYMFRRKEHVVVGLPQFEPFEEVHVAIDFNVGIQASVIFAIRGSQMHIIGEMQGHPDTESLAKALKAKFPTQKINAYPDPSGKSRKSSAAVGVTDFTILESYGIRVLARSQVPIVDSSNAVNRKLKNANGVIDMYIDSTCVNTIRSLERTVWVESNPNTATIDKAGGYEHWSDGIRYAVDYIWPIRKGVIGSIRGNQF